MSDEFEYEEALPDVLRRPTTAYHSEYRARLERREAVASNLANQRTQRRIAEDRENERWCRPLTAADVATYDRYQSHTDDQNHRTARELRDRDRLLAKCDALMARDLDLYHSSGISDKHAALQGIKPERYKGN